MSEGQHVLRADCFPSAILGHGTERRHVGLREPLLDSAGDCCDGVSIRCSGNRAASYARAGDGASEGHHVPQADCERRERQRQMKNDEWQPLRAAREEFFRGVEPEAAQTLVPSVSRQGARTD